MASKNYTSPSSGEPCTAAQYIAEILITRQEAANNNPVPYKFWNLPKYKKRYIQQMVWVNALLKTCDERAVIAALNSKNGKSIYSTANKYLQKLIDVETAKLKEIENNLESVIEPVFNGDNKPMKRFESKKSTLGILRELDGRREAEEDKADGS